MALTLKEQESLHRLSSRHRGLLTSATAGCFCCGAIFHPSEVEQWTDGSRLGGVTALCPRCGIDAVIPEAEGVAINPELLANMEAHWFADADIAGQLPIS